MLNWTDSQVKQWLSDINTQESNEQKSDWGMHQKEETELANTNWTKIGEFSAINELGLCYSDIWRERERVSNQLHFHRQWRIHKGRRGGETQCRERKNIECGSWFVQHNMLLGRRSLLRHNTYLNMLICYSWSGRISEWGTVLWIRCLLIYSCRLQEYDR